MQYLIRTIDRKTRVPFGTKKELKVKRVKVRINQPKRRSAWKLRAIALVAVVCIFPVLAASASRSRSLKFVHNYGIFQLDANSSTTSGLTTDASYPQDWDYLN